MEKLTLLHASPEQPEAALNRFKKFIVSHPNPYVTIRSDDQIRSVIKDESLYFVQNSLGNIVAATALYVHDESNTWAEIGSTLVDASYQGVGLQVVMYSHILALRRLTDWPSNVFAVVDHRAEASWKNVERSGFERILSVPSDLRSALPGRNWNSINDNQKRLYCLYVEGLCERLLYVADRGREHGLFDKVGRQKFSLEVQFRYWRLPETMEALRQDAKTLAATSHRKKLMD
jgi:hypothetical protein